MGRVCGNDESHWEKKQVAYLEKITNILGISYNGEWQFQYISCILKSIKQPIEFITIYLIYFYHIARQALRKFEGLSRVENQCQSLGIKIGLGSWKCYLYSCKETNN